MNKIVERLKLTLARVPNVSSPNFSDKAVLDIIKDAGFRDYVYSDRVPTGTGDDEQGSKGFWTRQQTDEDPIIYYNEVYSFKMDSNVATVVVSWEYEGNTITNNTCVTDFGNARVSSVLGKFRDGVSLSNSVNVIGIFDSFEAAKK